MKSKVASRATARARSARNNDAPLSTPTKMMGWPAKSRVSSAPISTTRAAIWSRENSTLSSGMLAAGRLLFCQGQAGGLRRTRRLGRTARAIAQRVHVELQLVDGAAERVAVHAQLARRLALVAM